MERRADLTTQRADSTEPKADSTEPNIGSPPRAKRFKNCEKVKNRFRLMSSQRAVPPCAAEGAAPWQPKELHQCIYFYHERQGHSEGVLERVVGLLDSSSWTW